MVQLTFENPVFLWLLFSIPLLWLTHFYWLRNTKRRAMIFANFRVFKRITGKNIITRNYSLLFLRTIMLLCAVLIASGAIIWYEGQANDNAFVILLDSSPSMLAQDVQPNRMLAAREDAKLFVESLTTRSEVGVASYAGIVFIEQTLTQDRTQVLRAIDEAPARGAGGTDLPAALITGANLLSNTDKGKVVVLLSDGSSTIESFAGESIREATGYLQEQRVIVHTIGIGTTGGSTIGYLPTQYNIPAIFREDTLRYIANQTGGTYIHSSDREELEEAFRTIASDSSIALLKTDLVPGLIVVLLILLFVEWGLISTRFRTIP